MQPTLFVAIAAVLGLSMGLIQLRIFASAPDAMPFSEHLERLRTHLNLALAVLAILLSVAFLFDARIEFLESTANAFVLCWIAGVALALRLFVRYELKAGFGNVPDAQCVACND